MLLLSTLRDLYLEGVERRECFFLSIVAIKFWQAWTNTSDDLFQFPCTLRNIYNTAIATEEHCYETRALFRLRS